MVELEESITKLIRAEPKSDASKQARKMGLKYLGFGRYADHSGNVAYIVVKDKLVPYKKDEELGKMFHKAVENERKKAMQPPSKPGEKAKVKKDTGPTQKDINQIASAKRQREAEDKRVAKEKKKEIDAIAKELTSFYAGAFSEDEMAAISEYTNDSFVDINSYLYNGHAPGTDYQSAKHIESMVDKLDSAFEETEAPFKYTTYTGLSKRYNAKNFVVGKDYIFKGYISTSLDHSVAGGAFSDYSEKNTATKGEKGGVMLELEIPKGAKSIYIPNELSAQSEDEYETILPRGTKIKVVSGPHKVPSKAFINPNYANDYMDSPGDEENFSTVIFKCKIVKDE